MSLLPVRPGRLSDPSFLQTFQNRVEEELLDFVTTPAGGGHGSRPGELFKRFQEESQLPNDVQIQDMFVRICQDIRLTPDEIDEPKTKYFS